MKKVTNLFLTLSIVFGLLVVPTGLVEDVYAVEFYTHPNLEDCISLIGAIDFTDRVESLNRSEKRALARSCDDSYRGLTFLNRLTPTICDSTRDRYVANVSDFEVVPRNVTLANSCFYMFPTVTSLSASLDVTNPSGPLQLGGYNRMLSIRFTPEDGNEYQINKMSFDIGAFGSSVAMPTRIVLLNEETDDTYFYDIHGLSTVVLDDLDISIEDEDVVIDVYVEFFGLDSGEAYYVNLLPYNFEAVEDRTSEVIDTIDSLNGNTMFVE